MLWRICFEQNNIFDVHFMSVARCRSLQSIDKTIAEKRNFYCAFIGLHYVHENKFMFARHGKGAGELKIEYRTANNLQ